MMRRYACLLALLAHPVGAAPAPKSPFASVTTSCVKLSTPRTYYVGGAERTSKVALEVVTTYRDREDVEIFAHAVTPQLLVGARAADEGRVTGPATVTWSFFEPAALTVGDPLRYGMPRGVKIDVGKHTARCAP